MSKKQKRDTESITFRLRHGISTEIAPGSSTKRHKHQYPSNSNNKTARRLALKRIEGWLYRCRAFGEKLMDRISENDITSISEGLAKNETKDFVLLLRNEYSLESALKQ